MHRSETPANVGDQLLVFDDRTELDRAPCVSYKLHHGRVTLLLELGITLVKGDAGELTTFLSFSLRDHSRRRWVDGRFQRLQRRDEPFGRILEVARL